MVIFMATQICNNNHMAGIPDYDDRPELVDKWCDGCNTSHGETDMEGWHELHIDKTVLNYCPDWRLADIEAEAKAIMAEDQDFSKPYTIK